MKQKSSNLDSVMEARDHSKNGVSSKNHTSREHFNRLKFALLTLITVFIFASCSKDKDNDTTYTFKNNIEDTSGVSIRIVLYEYDDDDDVVNEESFTTKYGVTKVFTADSDATLVKVKITFSGGSISNTYWFKETYKLKKGKNVNIELEGETLLLNREP